MERKSLAGLCFIVLILVAARVHAEEYLDKAEDAEEYLIQAEGAEEYLVQAQQRCGPNGPCLGCAIRCSRQRCRSRCIGPRCICFP